ncbi:MAG: PadR family transcriptional regulator [Herbiconiux sp.]|nr:PadR family transcriptional regulator [Herbiconiux sp.]
MSIRAGILAVLCEADAYGLQIHAELETRTDRVGRINVGQIYSTLDRLTTSGLVEHAGATDDGLPLYRATATGRESAAAWLDTVEVSSPTAWPDMTFRLLLATSLEGADSEALVERYRAAWAEAAGGPDGDRVGIGPLDPAALARRRLAAAALGWLDDLQSLPGGLPALRRPLRNERPRRGRRPATAAPTPE